MPSRNTIYCGVDFHARTQTVAYFDSADGELHIKQLEHHTDELQKFYSQFKGSVIVGLEATGYSLWFETLIEELGHQVWVGHSSEIRRFAKRRQKNDRRDAELILDLLVKGDFLCIHRRNTQSNEVLRQLRYRHRLVKMMTMINNSLQALAISSGLGERANLLSQEGRKRLEAARMSETQSQQCSQWLELLKVLEGRILSVEKWLTKQGSSDERVRRLQTHPGIGLMTSLCLVHTLDRISRYSNQRKVVAYAGRPMLAGLCWLAYAGLEPMERSSGDKKRYIAISKEGSKLLRYLLEEAGQSAARCDEELKRFYKRLVEKRGLGKAKVAVGRKLLIRSYIMLSEQIDYEEFLRRGVEARLARNDNRHHMPEA